MTPQQLKNSILQRAIEGRLVEQRPEEGTAKELLKEIQAEKAQLIKEGKIKKSKTLPPITEEEKPFDIPEGWEWVRLGDIIQISSGDGLTSKNMINNGIPVYGGNGITGYHNESNIDKETVVIGRVGFYCGSVHVTPPKAWVTDNAFITVYPEKFIDRSYLVFILRHMKLGKDNNATAQPVVSGKKIYPMLFPLPPLAEQRRIVAKIEELLPLIDKYDKAYTKLTDFNTRFPEAMKKSLLQYAIQGKLVEQRADEGTAQDLIKDIQAEKERLIAEKKIKKPKALPPITEEEIPFDIPESWEWVRLGEISLSVADGDHQAPPKASDGIPFLVISNVSGGRLDFSNTRFVPKEYFDKLSSERIAELNDILFTVTGSYGIPILVETNRQFCFQRHIALIKSIMITEYLLWALNSPLIKQYCDNVATGTAQKTVGLTSLKNMIIPLPPLAEQHRIVAKLEEMLPFCDQLIK